MTTLESTLKKHQHKFEKIISHDLNDPQVVVFDFTAANRELDEVDINDETSFCNYIFGKLAANGTPVGVGGYKEDRLIYKRSDVFTKNDPRSVHLGIDIWAVAGTPIYAPLDGIVHSFQNNSAHGDYGPTIIIEHSLDGITFYTLYGHLSLDSIESLTIGQSISKSKILARLGNYDENVHWPPHLHFQIISDMGEHMGDFPGVAAPAQAEHYFSICPDPNLILQINKLSS